MHIKTLKYVLHTFIMQRWFVRAQILSQERMMMSFFIAQNKNDVIMHSLTKPNHRAVHINIHRHTDMLKYQNPSFLLIQ